jgi:hypothetical protein
MGKALTASSFFESWAKKKKKESRKEGDGGSGHGPGADVEDGGSALNFNSSKLESPWSAGKPIRRTVAAPVWSRT